LKIPLKVTHEDNRDEAVVVSREDVMVNREDQEYQTRSRRSSERTSNSYDVEIREVEPNDPPARSRASRILGPIERLFRRRDRDREERETASYEGLPDTEASSVSWLDRQEVTARETVIEVALPEPLRRLFIRRRRIRDIESLEDD
jgi:hypothetical protein